MIGSVHTVRQAFLYFVILVQSYIYFNSWSRKDGSRRMVRFAVCLTVSFPLLGGSVSTVTQHTQSAAI